MATSPPGCEAITKFSSSAPAICVPTWLMPSIANRKKSAPALQQINEQNQSHHQDGNPSAFVRGERPRGRARYNFLYVFHINTSCVSKSYWVLMSAYESGRVKENDAEVLPVAVFLT